MFYFSGFLQTFTSLIEKVFINFRVILFYFYKNIISIGRYKYFTLLFNPTLDSQNNSQLPCTVCVALCCEMRQNVITITLPTYHIKIETINYFLHFRKLPRHRTFFVLFLHDFSASTLPASLSNTFLLLLFCISKSQIY